jgi:chloride channel 3/4/5
VLGLFNPTHILTDPICRISFKRKQRQPAKFSFSRLFFRDEPESTIPFRATNTTNEQTPEVESSLSQLRARNGNGNLNAPKDGGFLDWYVEGPGRRVGYDDLTAIDWIFEYTKERQRKRLLYSSAPGLSGYARRLLEASNVWVVLIATGVLVGIIAACIDITSDWLGDLKTGYCKNGPGGGKFYLNRSFCCWGHDGKVFVLRSALLQLTRISIRHI